MKSTPFYFALLCFIYSGYGVLEPEYKYIEAIQGEMKLHPVPTNWENARLFCHLEGGRLASPENKHMVEAMKKTMKNQTRNSPVLTGVTSLIGGVFITGNGTPLSELPVEWAHGEPDNYLNGEKCLVMSLNGKVADKRCDEVFPYICFRDGKRQNALTKRKSLGVCGDYVYVGGGGNSCYKYHSDVKIFKHAYLTCYFEGGHLVVINSEAEALALLDLIKEYGTNDRYNYALVGIKDWNEQKNWLTIFGETLESAGYAKWGPGEPNNGGVKKKFEPVETCGAFMKTGFLNDVSCTRSAPFICERKQSLKNNTQIKTTEQPKSIIETMKQSKGIVEQESRLIPEAAASSFTTKLVPLDRYTVGVSRFVRWAIIRS